MRSLSVPALLITAALVSSASAQVVATDPEPPPPATVATDPAPPPATVADRRSNPDRVEPEPALPATVWYGEDILIAGAVTASVTMIGVSMLAAGEGDGELAQAGAAIAGLGFLGHVISGPALHGAEVGGWRVWLSLSSRAGLGLGIPAIAAGICGSRGGCEHAGPILAGTFAAGTIVPVVLDAAIAWRPPRPHERAAAAVVPYAAPTAGGLSVGVGGRF